jgi:hypothetical protein
VRRGVTMKRVRGNTVTVDKWNALLSNDRNIRAAAEQLRPYGEFWINVLGQVYFALNEDRTHLSSIVAQLVERARTEYLATQIQAKAQFE